ncbi:MAG TPA: hypothetical protein VEJ16_12130 [Alphaproteobacteria bacterium]|nr:hypothetical protein [Alphaproteobacteria bacterium]
MMQGISRRTNARRDTMRLVLAASLTIAAALPWAATAQNTDQAAPPPQDQDRFEPILGGHDLQPRQGELGKPDVSSKDAQTVDDLYQKLIDEEVKAGNLPPSAASPAKRTPPQNTNQQNQQ